MIIIDILQFHEILVCIFKKISWNCNMIYYDLHTVSFSFALFRGFFSSSSTSTFITPSFVDCSFFFRYFKNTRMAAPMLRHATTTTTMMVTSPLPDFDSIYFGVWRSYLKKIVDHFTLRALIIYLIDGKSLPRHGFFIEQES